MPSKYQLRWAYSSYPFLFFIINFQDRNNIFIHYLFCIHFPCDKLIFGCWCKQLGFPFMFRIMR